MALNMRSLHIEKKVPTPIVLENGALLSKKGTKTVPLWQSAPHQKSRQNQYPFAKGHQNSATKGTVYGLKPEVWGRVVPYLRAELQVDPGLG